MRNLLMIGGIEIFLPLAQRRQKSVLQMQQQQKNSQLRLSGKRSWSRYLKLPKQKRENEHSEEWLNAFSQEAEEAVALKLTAEEAEEDDEHSEEWLNIFSQETEKTATWEFAEEEEEADNISLLICMNRLKPWREG
jgi:hypothetical protein